VPPAVEPAYYKVNLLASELTAAQAEQAIERLRRAGFWAGRWPLLIDIPHLVGRFGGRSGIPNMRKMARQGLHLPVHQEMSQKDLDQMVDTLYTVHT
jgi:dTDP-4-amino-4,6-dideoxygalactose transaminase